jgi:hypothetical protein
MVAMGLVLALNGYGSIGHFSTHFHVPLHIVYLPTLIVTFFFYYTYTETPIRLERNRSADLLCNHAAIGAGGSVGLLSPVAVRDEG